MTRHADEVKLRTTEEERGWYKAQSKHNQFGDSDCARLSHDIDTLLSANAELQAQYDAAGKASAETLTQLIECEKAHAAIAAKCERMEKALSNARAVILAWLKFKGGE